MTTPTMSTAHDGLDKWLANSPDLNPIENLWSHFQNAVAFHRPKTTAEFKTVLEEVWWEKEGPIRQDYVRNLFHSIPSRVREVIRLEGGVSRC